MYNYFHIAGYITSDIVLRKVQNKKVVNITLKVRRDFKNVNGTYSNDLITVSFWDFLAEMVEQTLKKGMPVGIRGRIAPADIVDMNGYKPSCYNLIGEKLIYFNTKGNNQDSIEEEGNETVSLEDKDSLNQEEISSPQAEE